MGVREETLELLKLGKTPGEISKTRGVTIKTTIGYVDQLLVQGRVRRSEILLTLPASRRQNPADGDDRLVLQRYGAAEKLLGEIYEDVRFIEVNLHQLIRETLIVTYGGEENGWWRKGIPINIRQKCQARREEDNDPVEPYNYTDLIDLREIIDKQWTVIKGSLTSAARANKKQLLADLLRLNIIRRVVMHPARDTVPTEEDFDFLRRLRRYLESD